MNIQLLFKCLTENEKKELRHLLEIKIIDKNDMSIIDWIKITEPYPRLANTLKILNHSYYQKEFINITANKITKEIFFKVRNAGLKTWQEFQDLKNDL